jgi:hypothetical protein
LAAMRLPVNLPRLTGLCLVREKHMDNSQRDIDPDIFEYLSKLPPDILEKVANEGLRAQEDQIYREVLLPLSWECLKSYFTSKDDFNSFIESFANPKDKKKFIYLSAFWKVMGDDYHGAYPQSIQLIVLFSIIEKLYENEWFIDFYTWLDSGKVERERQKSHKKTADIIQKLKEQWRSEYGVSEKCRRFSRECLSNEDRTLISAYFRITNSNNEERNAKSIDEVSGIIISLRNAFIHSACTMDVFLSNGSTYFTSIFSTKGNKVIDTSLSFEKLIDLFKRGFIKYFKERCTSK